MGVVEKLKGEHFDNGPVDATGQHEKYAVLPKSERDKGFVRPVRQSYVHVGPEGPKYPLRDLTDQEKEWFAKDKDPYIKFEVYPEGMTSTGKFYTQFDLDNKGCGVLTTMGIALAETYARDPSYYGATFCCGCHKHLPVNEFVWDGTSERVGS
jgi:hypothetical protein